MPHSTSSKLRFPLLFGAILAGFAVAFWNRDKFMTDLQEERQKLDREEEGSRQILAETIESFNKARAAKRQQT